MFRVKASLIPTLLELLLLGAKDHTVLVSTTELSKRLGKSQQSASKHLMELEKEGYVERARIKGKTAIKLTSRGQDALHAIHLTLQQALGVGKGYLRFTGKVFSGLGEGAYYISMRGYRKQFISKLGFDPYPGTLNIKLENQADKDARRDLGVYSGVRIEGFEDESRTYGPVKCFFAEVNDKVKGAALAIERTHYDYSVLEIIAGENIREKLSLSNGSPVDVKVFLTQTRPDGQ